MTEWVSQSDAVKLLKALGDPISQPALSQYLKGHGEVPTQPGGAGRPTLIDFDALKRSRATRNGRGPSSAPLLDLAEAGPPANARRGEKEPSDLGARKARADTERAEFDARRARILAEEAEGALINRDVATAAFMAAGVALIRALEEGRRTVIEDIRAAADTRAADLVMRKYETQIRTGFAQALTEFAAAADPIAVAAE